MPNENSRNIPTKVKLQLVARAAGRCEFPGCNKILFEELLTRQRGNFSNFAHIIPFEENGPRGAETLCERPSDIHCPDNLMLLCWEHHRLVDNMPVSPQYAASKLRRMKKEHEDRIESVTSIQAGRQLFVVSYAVRIAQTITSVSAEEAKLALLEDGYYPAQSDVIELSPEQPNTAPDEAWYRSAVEDLRGKFNEFISRRIRQNESARFAIFALAPMPLLLQLGALFGDTTNVRVYQKQRDRGWNWNNEVPTRIFNISAPPETEGRTPVLLITLTQEVNESLIKDALGNNVAIWKISSTYHGFDFILKSRHLEKFKSEARNVLNDVLRHFPNGEYLNIFPIMPASACVEFGRIRTAAHNPWRIYEKRRDTDAFIQTISI